MSRNTGAIILAAGNSSRMGSFKFLLPMPDGLTFFEKIVLTFLEYGIKKIIVVTQARYLPALTDLCRSYEIKPHFVVNDLPEKEKFHSLQLGIKAIGNVAFSFIHNADSPFVDVATLKELELNKYKADYICPVFDNKGGHPILINAATMKHLLARPNNAILKDELKAKKRLNIPVENSGVTADINTPEDYSKYFKKSLAQHI